MNLYAPRDISAEYFYTSLFSWNPPIFLFFLEIDAKFINPSFFFLSHVFSPFYHNPQNTRSFYSIL